MRKVNGWALVLCAFILVNSVGVVSAKNFNITGNGADIFFVNGTSGNVGIGTGNPSAQFDVDGHSIFNGDTSFGSNSVVSADMYLYGALDNNYVRMNRNTANLLNFDWQGTSTGEFSFDGNVGIGATPSSTFSVSGAINILNQNNLPATTAGTTGLVMSGYSSTGSVIGRTYIGDGLGYSYHLSKRKDSVTTDLVTFKDTGNVGIGTPDPQNKLNVIGDLNVTNGAYFTGDVDFNGGWTNEETPGVSIIDGAIYAQTGYFYNISSLQVTTLSINGSINPMEGYDNTFDLGSSDLRWNDLYLGGDANVSGEVLSYGTGDNYFAGKVGIGTTSPESILDVRGNKMSLSGSTTSSLEGLSLQTQYVATNTNSRMFFSENINKLYGFSMIYAGGTNPTFDGTAFTLDPNKFYLLNHENSETGNIAMSVDRATGDMGIGTDEPDGNRLNVVGDDGVVSSLHSSVDDHKNILFQDTADLGVQFASDNAGLVGTAFIMTNQESPTDGRHWTFQHRGTTGDNRLSFTYVTSTADGENLLTGGTEHLTILKGGNVGIGTTAPASELDVNGTIIGRNSAKFYSTEAGETDVRFTINTEDADLTRIYNANESGASFNSILFGGNPGLYNGITVTADGNVGIGTTNPGAKLDVNGSTLVRGSFSSEKAFNSIDNGLLFDMPLTEGSGNPVDRGKNGLTITLSNSPTWVDGKYGEALSFDGVDQYGTITDTDSVLSTALSSVELMYKANSSGADTGGIMDGVLASSARFTLFWRTDDKFSIQYRRDTAWYRAEATISDTEWHHIIMTFNTSSDSISLWVDGLEYASFSSQYVEPDTAWNFGKRSTYYDDGTIGQMRIYDRILNDGEIRQRYMTSLGENNIYIDTDGNVGIGTTSPDALLHINSSTALGASLKIESNAVDGSPFVDLTNDARSWFILNNGDISDKFSIYDATESEHRLVIDSSGNVGIGTVEPSSKLEIADSGHDVTTLTLEIGNTSATGNSHYQDLDFSHLSYTVTNTVNRIRSKMIPGWGGEMQFWTMDNSDNTLKQRMTIDTAGNVGIGTNDPDARLDVNGDFRIQNNALYVDTGGLLSTTAGSTPGKAFSETSSQNLVVNGDLESWTAGTSTLPDGWKRVGSSASARETTTVKTGTYSGKFTAVGSYNYIGQNIPARGISTDSRTYTISFWYYSPSTNTVSKDIAIHDGTSYLFTVGLTSDDSWHQYTRTFTAREDRAIDIYWWLTTSTSDSDDYMYIDDLRLFEGPMYFAYNDRPLSTSGNETHYGDLYNMGGNVGIGTTEPGEKLDILGSGTVANPLKLRAGTALSTLGQSVGLQFYESGGTIPVGALTSAAEDSTHISLAFSSYNSVDHLTERMRIDGDGNVGINTTSPGYPLDVDGDINVQTGHKFLLEGNEIAIPSDENLMGYWALDDGSGTLAVDGSGNGNDGTLVNSPAWIDGVVGKELDFEVDDYVSVPHSSDLTFSTGSFSISCWAYLGADSESYGRIAGKKGVAGAAAGYSIYWRSSLDKLLWSTADGASGTEIYTASTIPRGLHHVVMIRDVDDPEVGFFYIDGVKYSLASTPTIRDVTNTDTFYIGSIGTSLSFNDSIDEVRVYDTALTEAEVRALYLYPAGNKGLKINARQLAGDLIVDSDGNVGIGTSNPNTKLDIQGATGTSLTVGITNQVPYRFRAKINYDYANPIEFTGYNDVPFLKMSNGDEILSLWTNENERLTIIAGGNVGIGTSEPLSIQHINSDSPYLTFSRDSTSIQIDDTIGLINFYSKDTSTTSLGGLGNIAVKSSIKYDTSGTPSYMTFSTHADSANDGSVLGNVVERMRIDADGNVGIGITDPDETLEVGGTIRGTHLWIDTNTIEERKTDTDTASVNINYRGYAGGTTKFRNLFVYDGKNSPILKVEGSSGNVGIGTTTPTQPLDVAGNININSSTAAYMYDGQQALMLSKGSLDSVYVNTIVGAVAGNSTSYRQTAIGYGAGLSSTGTGQTAIGFQAGASNTGNYQSALGYLAGQLNTGSSQTTMGYYAGYKNTGASQTASGYYAGYNNTGNNQVAIGYQAGKDNTAADQAAVGNNAGYQNTGSSQSALGYTAGYQNTGSYQIAIGRETGRENTGNFQVALGYQAGYQNSGDDVVALGYQAGKSNTADDQFIVQQANINAMPLIQGNFSSGNVGIGTTAPASSLDVNGTITGRDGAKFYSDEAGETDVRFTINTDVANFTRIYNLDEGDASFNSVQFGGNPSLDNGITVTADGYSGINVTDPTSLLQLSNDGWISAKNAAGDGVINMFKVNSENQIEVGAALNVGTFEFAADSGLVTFADMPVTSDASEGTPESYVFKVDGDNIMSIYSESDGAGGVQNKRVGIGTVTPKNALNVIGDINATGNIYGNAIYEAGVALSSKYVPYTGASQNVSLGDNNFSVGGSDLFVNSNTGNVGIGTTSPDTKLEIQETTADTDIITRISQDGGSTAKAKLQLYRSSAYYGELSYENGANLWIKNNRGDAGGFIGFKAGGDTERMRITYDGKVGINTTAPLTRLDLGDFDTSSATPSRTLGNYQLRLGVETGSGYSNNIAFSAGTSSYPLAAISAVDDGSDAKTGLTFMTGQYDSMDERMRIDSSGNVGIGTTNPDVALHVDGTIQVGLSSADYFTKLGHNDLSFNRTSGGLSYINQFGTGDLAFRFGSTPTTRMTIKNDGKVGIGEVNPDGTLHIADSENSAILTYENEDGRKMVLTTPDKDDDQTPWIWSTGNSYRWDVDTIAALTIAYTGKVGIGTTNPSTTLDVNSSNANGIVLSQDSVTATNSGRLFFANNVGANAIMRGGDYLSFRTGATAGSSSGTVRMAIEDDGDVGIGTTNPESMLHINGSNAILRLQDDDDANSYFEIDDKQASQVDFKKIANSGQALMDMTPKVMDGTSSAIIRFFRETDTSGAKSLQLYKGDNTATLHAQIGVDGQNTLFGIGGGKVGIGTSSPGVKFEVNGTGDIVEFGNGGTNGITFNPWSSGLNIDPVTASDNLYFGRDVAYGDVIFQSGNVGIGTTSPQTELQVNGGLRISNDDHSVAQGDVSLRILSLTAENSVIDYWDRGASSGGHFTIESHRDGTEAYTTLEMGGDGNIALRDGGNVGIGTTVPKNKLDVEGGAVIGASYSGTSTAPSNGLLIQGNVGIGTATPQFRATVTGASETYGDSGGIFAITDGTGVNTDHKLMFGIVSNTYSYIDSVKPGSATKDLSLNPSGGDVGIGVTNPTQKLQVTGDSQEAAGGSANDGIFRLSTGTGSYLNDSLIFGIHDDDYSWIQAVKPGSNYRDLVLNAEGGDVGIGTTSPSKKFEVNGTAGGLTIDVDTTMPTINTTSGNVTISSAGGSVIIRLG